MLQYWMERFRNAAREGWYDVPLYSAKCGAHISKIADYSGFLTIPFTHKQEIRDASSTALTAAQPGEVFGLFSSSGTTGDSKYLVFAHKDKAVHSECAAACLGGIGVTAEDLGAVLAPIGQGMMGQAMMWQFTACGAGYINCAAPSPGAITEMIKRFPVTALAGFPNTMASVAAQPEFAAAAKASAVTRLLAGGDYMSSEKRDMLERLWCADCYNLYGISEVFGPVAAECKYKNGLHFLPQYFFVEVIDPDTLQPVPTGETGIAVYTTLWNKGFPLLRYWSDDYISLSYDACPCGSAQPRIWFRGRMADAFKNKFGRWVQPSDVEPILAEAHFAGVYRFTLAAGKYTLEMEYAEDSGPAWTNVREKLSALVGAETNLRFLQQGEISKGGGKYKRFIEG